MSEKFMSYEQASKAAVKLKIKSAREYRERYEQEEKNESSLNADEQKNRNDCKQAKK
ncbi:hypothetical protein L1D34_06670 [Vibrio mediterranei]|uniref:hypothetical protein n=1 Tax=Vibrio mediterranei TaxID=689 RepID=UPI001EFCFED6|nr:hypothetical protein [Vibrio mediterranei]MCG9624521.1 hypothetical protein [Vibrio mediterranei]